jgi:hypothetical protein
MKRHLPLLLLLAAALPVAAQGKDTFDRVEARVTSTGPVVIDRGSTDGVKAGDRVFFYPRGGETFLGAVLEVAERTSTVEVRAAIVPEPGTRAEVLVPRARRPKPKPKRKPAAVPEHPEWENQDEEWTPDQPLLSDIRPLRPEERSRKLSGRVYAIGQVTRVPGDNYDNSLLRVGTEVFLENAFRKGGSFHVDAETAYLYDFAGDGGNELLLRAFSYGQGGTRFEPMRWEAGRFQQRGMPEFGVLDGGEVAYRRENGHRFGASMGFLPDWDDHDQSFDDFQLAAFYEWIADLREELVLTAGYQKTWHNGAPDRDLLVAKLRYTPSGPEGWDVFATVWVDFYTGKDDVKGSGPEVTQGQLFLTRRWASGNGIDVTYRHLRLPQLLREEFRPLLDVGLDAYRYDRLSVSGWRWLNPAVRATGEIVGWNDENESGVSGEAGFDARDWFVEGSRTVFVAFTSFARFEDLLGARVSFGRSFRENGRWDVMYEFTFHHLEEFVNDRDDIFQHRVRASASLFLDRGWDLAAHVEVFLYDTELFWTLGFSVQKRF